MTESIPYQACPVCHGEGINNVFTTCTVCNGGKVIPMYVPQPQTNELMIAILESQLKVEQIKEDYWSDNPSLESTNNYHISRITILELERQLKELKE